MTSRNDRRGPGAPVLGLLAALIGCVLVAGCGTSPSTPAVAARVAPVLLAAHNDTSTPFNLVSIPALTANRYDGRGLRLERVLTRALAFTRYAVSYRSGDLRITGVMEVPTRAGRSPVVVVAHGWTDPARYRSGGMLERERAMLAEHGFVTFQVDYRNHAGSSRESGDVVARPLGYPEDVINAVRAVRRARLPFVDTERIGLLGRSMGGGVALNALVARPGLVSAAVLYSPVSTLAGDNYGRWVRPDPDLAARVQDVYGDPARRPRLWASASARSFLGRLALPVQIHHGIADRVCPVGWSRATTGALRAAGGDVTLYEYSGEDHRFDRSWTLFMQRTLTFLRRELA